MEIELIEVLEGETPHSEHLRDHGEGPQHIRFRIDGIEEKIALLALMELVFRRPADARSLAFADVAGATRLPSARGCEARCAGARRGACGHLRRGRGAQLEARAARQA